MSAAEGAKRSRAVTVIAVLLLFSGGCQSFASLSSLVMGPQVIAAYRTQVDTALRQMPVGEGEGRLTPEQAEEMRARFDRGIQVMEDLITSPVSRLMGLLGLLLALVVVTSGIGLLLKRSWARRLVIGQALISIPMAVWMNGWHYTIQQRWMEEFFSAMGDVATLDIRQAIEATVTTGVIVGVLVVVLWNGFLIWFIRRPSVKAELGSAPSSGG